MKKGTYDNTIIGKKFNMLTVIEYAGKTKDGKAAFLCKCDCGNTKIIKGSAIKSGSIKSCGCISYTAYKYYENCDNDYCEFSKYHTKLRSVWFDMKYRCNNPDHNKYYDYGGRGIKVCNEWTESYENFINSMGDKFLDAAKILGCKPEDLSIDRIDPDGNYDPDNCRWATTSMQNRNFRKTKKYEIYDQELSIPDAVDLYASQGVHTRLVKKRLSAGWEFYDALLTPPIRENQYMNGPIKPIEFLNRK